jgi:hypothetical protein
MDIKNVFLLIFFLSSLCFSGAGDLGAVDHSGAGDMGAVDGDDGEGCTPLQFSSPANRVDTVGQNGIFTFTFTGDCVFDSLHIINKGVLDSLVLNAAKNSLCYHWKSKFAATTCSISVHSNNIATSDDTAVITIRVTGPTMAVTPGSYTFVVGLSDTSDQVYADSLTDSITAATSPPGLSVFKTGANIGRWYGIATHTIAKAGHLKYAYKNGIKADSLYDSAWCKWDTLDIDSVGATDGIDTSYWDDVIPIYLSQLNKIKNLDSAYVGDSAAVVIDSVGDTISIRCPHVAIGFKRFSITDTVYSDTSIDSQYVAGLYDSGTVTLNPHDTTVTDGQTVYFHGTATGTGTLTYKWQVDDGGGWDDVAASNNDTITWAAATAENGYLYRMIVSTGRGADTSTTATLTVSAVTYTLTMTNDGHGTTDPSGAPTVAQGVATPITATTTTTGWGFLGWTVTAGSGATFGDAADSTTTVTLATGNATILASWDIDTHYVANTSDAHCQITYLTDSLAAYGENVTLYLQVDAHYLATWPSGTDVGNDTLVVSVTKDTTVAATSRLIPSYTIDTVYDSHSPITTNQISLVYDSASPTPKCTLFCTPGSGYAAIWPGGTVYYPGRDTLIVNVTKDSTVTAAGYVIPVIDSIRDSTELRDSANPQAGRPLDTMIAYGVGFSTIGDSTLINLNSTGSVKGTIRSVSDIKLVFVIPTGTPRGWYSSWVRTKDMIAGTPKSHALLIKRPGGL